MVNDEPLTLSHSQLELFARCQQRWFRRYVKREPDIVGAPLIMGRAFHAAMEMNFKHRLRHHVDLDPKIVARCYREAFDAEADKPTFTDLETLTEDKIDWAGEDPKQLREQGQKTLLRYLKQHAPFLEPAEVEKRYEIEIAPNVRLVGVIDLLLTTGTIVDFKTVNYPWPEERAHGSLQPGVYSALRGAPSVFDFHFIVRKPNGVGISVRRTQRSQDDIDWLLHTHIPRIVEVIEGGAYYSGDAEDYFTRSPGQQCMTCPHRLTCGYRS